MGIEPIKVEATTISGQRRQFPASKSDDGKIEVQVGSGDELADEPNIVEVQAQVNGLE